MSSKSPSPSTTTTTTTTTTDRFQKEIDRLHDFFVQWFTGSMERSDQSFLEQMDRFMHSQFHLINPQGVLTPRGPLIEALKGAYGCRQGQVFRIECKHVQVVSYDKDGSTYLVMYEEWQQVQETLTARIVSAWFQEEKGNNNDDEKVDSVLKWRHVHETWMPGMSPPSETQQMWTPQQQHQQQEETE
jgi:hypothetical protein